MKIVITSKKPINDDVKGRLANNTVIDLPDHKAMFYIERGEAVRFETKELQDNPLKTVGEAVQSSASHQGEVLKSKTLKSSSNGEKKTQGRKKR
jgi:hypothetical protein